MNPPLEEKAAAKLRQAIKILAGNAPDAFNIFLGWLASELVQRDKDNRVVGQANTTSEAHALGVIVEHVAACLAPVTDRDQQDSTDAEGTSADNIM